MTTGISASPTAGHRCEDETITVTVTAQAYEVGLIAGTASPSTINGVDATGFTDNNDGTYSFTYTVGSGDTDRAAGVLPVSITLKDAAGNENSPYTTSPDPSAAVAVACPGSGNVHVCVGACLCPCVHERVYV